LTNENNRAALRRVQQIYLGGTVSGLSDGQLLERFTARSDEGGQHAFEQLVDRHGPMVLRVCRSVLRNDHDAEDAFQATFLILARKAHSLRVGDSLSPWLFGVSTRTALRARSGALRRRALEHAIAAVSPHFGEMVVRDDVGPLVLNEVDRLPEPYRSAVVLCNVEGLTQQQAALRLNWPIGTLQSRLARGRAQLRERLIRRGLAPSAGVFTAGWLASDGSAGAAVLIESTARAVTSVVAGKTSATTVGLMSMTAFTLAQAGIRSMFLAKLKTTAVLLVLAFLATSAVVLARQGPSGSSQQNDAAGLPPRAETRAPDAQLAAADDATIARLKDEVRKSQAQLDEAESIRFIRDISTKSDWQDTAKRQIEAVRELNERGILVPTYAPNALGKRLRSLPNGFEALYYKALGTDPFVGPTVVSVTKPLEIHQIVRVVKILRGFEQLECIAFLTTPKPEVLEALRQQLPKVRIENGIAKVGARLQVHGAESLPVAIDFGFPIVRQPTNDIGIFSFVLGTAY
jgi:RNA polymerase sigma factor (sigma-70 family)